MNRQPQPHPRAEAGPSRTPSASSASNTSVYPGSTFGITPTASRSSNASTASDRSIVVLDTICSNHSIKSLIETLSRENHQATTLKVELDSWAQKINPTAYQSREPWTPAMERAHNRYKELANVIGEKHKAFKAYRNKTAVKTTPEQHIERARLAIVWGQGATK